MSNSEVQCLANCCDRYIDVRAPRSSLSHACASLAAETDSDCGAFARRRPRWWSAPWRR
jgi:hypothetical protein